MEFAGWGVKKIAGRGMTLFPHLEQGGGFHVKREDEGSIEITEVWRCRDGCIEGSEPLFLVVPPSMVDYYRKGFGPSVRIIPAKPLT